MSLKYPSIDKRSGRRSPTGRTLWCGPFAIAMLSGLEYDDAYAKALAVVRREHMAVARLHAKRYGTAVSKNGLPRSIQGLSHEKTALVLNRLKIKTKLTRILRKTERPTLLTFARNHTIKGRTYICVAGHHWVVIKDGVLYHAHHDPIALDDAPRYRLAKVDSWAEVKPLPAAILEEVA